jgi:hypothetical protein
LKKAPTDTFRGRVIKKENIILYIDCV